MVKLKLKAWWNRLGTLQKAMLIIAVYWFGIWVVVDFINLLFIWFGR